MNKFRTLRADEIECRVSRANAKSKKAYLLLYKDARCDMNLLDETYGSENWQTEHYEVKSKDFCRLAIRMDGEWVYKSDCGSESNIEAAKGESSDSLKRAAFQFGLGRELYTAPDIEIDLDEKDFFNEKISQFIEFKVTDIAYKEDGTICYLVINKINGNKTEPCFIWGNRADAVEKFDPQKAYKALLMCFEDSIAVGSCLKSKGAERPSRITPEIFREAVFTLSQVIVNGKETSSK